VNGASRWLADAGDGQQVAKTLGCELVTKKVVGVGRWF
jgi:hypothetical protein